MRTRACRGRTSMLSGGRRVVTEPSSLEGESNMVRAIEPAYSGGSCHSPPAASICSLIVWRAASGTGITEAGTSVFVPSPSSNWFMSFTSLSTLSFGHVAIRRAGLHIGELRQLGDGVAAERRGTHGMGEVDQHREATVLLECAIGKGDQSSLVDVVNVRVEDLRWRHR